MKTNSSVLWLWLPFALTGTILAGLVYVAVQQNYRQNANDPQIELAESAAAVLATGQPPQMFGSNTNTDIAISLSPFIIVYDEQGKPVSGTASLNGVLPTPPAGVLSASKSKGENRLTWEPMHGVRIATIIVHYDAQKPGYVLVGRSLREVEKRENELMVYVFVAWVAILLSTSIVNALCQKKYFQK